LLFLPGTDFTHFTDLIPCIRVSGKISNSSGHPSVAPTSPAATHIVKALVSSLQSDILPGTLTQPLSQALKSHLSGMPDGSKITLPQDVRDKLAALA
jgi:hypothetical protein